MKILTKKNGIALIAVLTVLLVLTLLLPAMFTMSEIATKQSLRGRTEQKASYFARTSLEMSVSAFQDIYDEAMEQKDAYEAAKLAGKDKISDFPVYEDYKELTTFPEDQIVKESDFSAQTLYVFEDTSAEFPIEENYDSETAYKDALSDYEKKAIIYKTSDESPGSQYKLIATADCEVTYEEVSEYYKILTSGATQLITHDYETYSDGSYVLDLNGEKKIKKHAAEKYKEINDKVVAAVSAHQSIENMEQCYKIDRKEVRFEAVATMNNKTYSDFSRGCTMILPTKPAEEGWISIKTNVDGNQIFPDTDYATGVTEVTYNKNWQDPGAVVDSMSQPVYMFSCVGNMVISNKGIEGIEDKNFADLSLGLYPTTTTMPDNDPTFACLKANNMKDWHESAQKDNFVMFSATNGIQMELPVKLLVNPCRTGRIGDGLQGNEALYKMLVFQSPNILFKESVTSMISLWTDTGISDAIRDLLEAAGINISSYDAPRMTSIIFSAPDNTPYFYENQDRDREVVKAGKVIFMQDSYIWLIPFSEDGSNYKTQTVYYKGSDIQLYKFANAGDVYYFNSQVPVNSSTGDEQKTTGFSLSAWFMDVKYPEIYGNDEGLNFFENFKNKAFGFARDIYEDILGQADYRNDDFHYVGNIYDGTAGKVPAFDDFYVVWDS